MKYIGAERAHKKKSRSVGFPVFSVVFQIYFSDLNFHTELRI